MSINRKQILEDLNFGNVDAKQDELLKDWFISTNDFKKFFNKKYYLILGGKGSGKSAIFNLVIKYKNIAENLSGEKLENILILPAYGLGHNDEINFEEIKKISPKNHNDFLFLWKLYIALRIGALIIEKKEIFKKQENLLQKILKFRNKEKNHNFNEIVKYMRKLDIMDNGRPLKRLSKWFDEFLGVKIKLRAKDIEISLIDNEILDITKIKPNDLLRIEDDLLKECKKEIWILMDELDMHYSRDIKKRKIYLEALMQFLLFFIGNFSNIHLKIFLRTDIFNILQITNKSHLESGKLILNWNDEDLMVLLMTRIIYYDKVKSYFKSRNITLPSPNTRLTFDESKKIFYQIFDKQVKKGKKEAKYSHEWILNRITDGKGEKFPREFIQYGNFSIEEQKKLNEISVKYNTDKLISGKAIENSLNLISSFRVDTYLNSEFPYLKKHFNKLKGLSSKKISRKKLEDLFNGLSPSGNEAIEQIFETGLLKIKDQKVIDSAQAFEIPSLYLSGLGIITRGRK